MNNKIISPWIDQSAAAAARAYSTWISFSDVRQQLWLWAVKNEARVSEYLDHEEGERIIRSILNQEARSYALKERAVSTGYSPEDLAWYTPRQIKAVLPDVFDHEDWQSFQQSRGDGRGSKPIEATGDKLTTIMDVKSALSGLQPEQVALLREHYGNGVSVEACAIALGLEKEATRKRIDRAVYAMRDSLNGIRQGDLYEAAQGQWDTRSKGRRAMSNAAARAATDVNWG